MIADNIRRDDEVSRQTSARVRRKPAGRYHHGNLQTSCLAFAARELEVRGPTEGLALRHLAKLLGVTQPALYRHFQSKEALVEELCLAGFRALRASFATVSGDTAQARLVAMTEAYLTYGLAQPQHYRLMFTRPLAEKQRSDDLVSIAAAARADLYVAVAAWSRETNQSEAINEEVAASLWALAHGLVLLSSEGHLPQGRGETLCAAAVTRLLQGSA